VTFKKWKKKVKMFGKNTTKINYEGDEMIAESSHNLTESMPSVKTMAIFIRIFFILMLLLSTIIFLSGNAYAYNKDTHEILLEQSLEVLKNSGAPNALDAYNFFTGNGHPNNPNNKDIRNYESEIMFPDLYSTTEPHERSIDNFLSDAKAYPSSIPAGDFNNIKWCIEELVKYIEDNYVGAQYKAAEETLIFTNEDPNRALYHLFPEFPVRKLNLPNNLICNLACSQIWGGNCQMCRDLGNTYSTHYLMDDKFSHTANYKTLEYSNYAVEEYRQDDIKKSFIWFVRSLQPIQHSTCPFKDRRPPEDPPNDVDDAKSRWCKELVHGVAYVQYCDWVDANVNTIPDPPFPPIV
jgi:hypothetical protein